MDPNRSTAWADPLVMKAQQVAADAHKGQKRKHSNDPYLIHPMRVARRVMTRPDATPEMVAAAWLHDVVEDTPVTLDEIGKEFGSEIAQLVRELTNASEGSRAPRKERKAMDRAKLAGASREAKIIKLLDRIDNLDDLRKSPADDDFRDLYAEESRALADAIGDADSRLKNELLQLADEVSPRIGT